MDIDWEASGCHDWKYEGRPCNCGSGKERYELEDARGIFCAYVCEKCEDKVKAKYRPEIFEDGGYYCEEQIYEDY